MSGQNEEIVTRWFTEYWGTLNPDVVDELAADDLLLRYPLGETWGREEARNRILGFKEMFPEGGFELTDELIVDGDRVVAQWEGGGTHTGPAWELPIGVLPEASGETMRYTGTTVCRLRNGEIAKEYGEGDYLKAMRQLGLVGPPPE
jgi:predicted ester cyclase